MNMIASHPELNAILHTTATVAANRLFFACERMRQRLDRTLNRCHRNALGTISHCLGNRPGDVAEFFNGRLTTRNAVPF